MDGALPINYGLEMRIRLSASLSLCACRTQSRLNVTFYPEIIPNERGIPVFIAARQKLHGDNRSSLVVVLYKFLILS